MEGGALPPLTPRKLRDPTNFGPSRGPATSQRSREASTGKARHVASHEWAHAHMRYLPNEARREAEATINSANEEATRHRAVADELSHQRDIADQRAREAEAEAARRVTEAEQTFARETATFQARIKALERLLEDERASHASELAACQHAAHMAQEESISRIQYVQQRCAAAETAAIAKVVEAEQAADKARKGAVKDIETVRAREEERIRQIRLDADARIQETVQQRELETRSLRESMAAERQAMAESLQLAVNQKEAALQEAQRRIDLHERNISEWKSLKELDFSKKEASVEAWAQAQSTHRENSETHFKGLLQLERDLHKRTMERTMDSVVQHMMDNSSDEDGCGVPSEEPPKNLKSRQCDDTCDANSKKSAAPMEGGLGASKGQFDDLIEAVLGEHTYLIEAYVGDLNQRGRYSHEHLWPVQFPPGGYTALCVAVVSGRRRSLESLLEAKADPRVTDEAGAFPQAIACAAGREDLAEILRSWPARLPSTGHTASIMHQEVKEENGPLQLDEKAGEDTSRSGDEKPSELTHRAPETRDDTTSATPALPFLSILDDCQVTPARILDVQKNVEEVGSLLAQIAAGAPDDAALVSDIQKIVLSLNNLLVTIHGSNSCGKQVAERGPSPNVCEAAEVVQEMQSDPLVASAIEVQNQPSNSQDKHLPVCNEQTAEMSGLTTSGQALVHGLDGDEVSSYNCMDTTDETVSNSDKHEPPKILSVDVPRLVSCQTAEENAAEKDPSSQSDLSRSEPALAHGLATSSAIAGTDPNPHDAAGSVSIECSTLFPLEVPQVVVDSTSKGTELESEAEASTLTMPKIIEEASTLTMPKILEEASALTMPKIIEEDGDENASNVANEKQDEDATLYPWSKHQFAEASPPETPHTCESEKGKEKGLLLGMASSQSVSHSEAADEQALLKQWLSRPCMSMHEIDSSEAQQREPWTELALPEDDGFDEVIARSALAQDQGVTASSRSEQLDEEISIADWWVQAIAPRGRDPQSLPTKRPLHTSEEASMSPDGPTRLLSLLPFSDPCVELMKGIG